MTSAKASPLMAMILGIRQDKLMKGPMLFTYIRWGGSYPKSEALVGASMRL